MPIPRNLRKPTPRRVTFWWRDYLRAWATIAGITYQDAWWAEQEVA